MISCLLIHLSRNQQGMPVGKEGKIFGDTLEIGRGASCKIYLQDHRVHLHHAKIKRSEDGSIYIDAEKDVEIKVNGLLVQTATLEVGARVEIGPYAIAVLESPAGCDLALSVEMSELHVAEQGIALERQRRTPVSVAALGLSKRKFSLILMAVIVFLFIELPLLPSLSVGLDRWQAALPFSLSESWSPGALASGHEIFGAKCSTCHEHALRAVSDDACLACHKVVASHLKTVTEHSRVSKKMRCTDCHMDHKGPRGLLLQDSSRCVGCHGSLKAVRADTPWADVKDFETAHPEFRISLPGAMADPGNGLHPLLSDKQALIDRNGLKYSHQVHLNPKGLSSPQGESVMVCNDCHRLEESGLHFLPIQMKRDCQQSGCHGLVFSDPLEGKVPHGSVREVVGKVREFHLNQLMAVGVLPSTECAQVKGNVLQRTSGCADKLTQKTLSSSLFRKNLDCGECHEITGGDDNAAWKFTPVKINRDWFPFSTFSHAKHLATPCSDCHDKQGSKLSTDISMPSIVKCRECHVGDRKARHKITSRCESCHRFHGDAKHQWGNS